MSKSQVLKDLFKKGITVYFTFISFPVHFFDIDPHILGFGICVRNLIERMNESTHEKPLGNKENQHVSYDMYRFVKSTNLFQSFKKWVCDPSICDILPIENYSNWSHYVFVLTVMLKVIIDDIFNMSEFEWKFFPQPENTIY